MLSPLDVRVIIKTIAIMLILAILASPFNSVPIRVEFAVAEKSEEEEVLIMLLMAALVFSDIPLEQVEKYELFHTLYIYKNGSIRLVNEPYLPGDLVLNVTKIAQGIKKSSNISITSSEGEVTVYINNTPTLSMIYGSELSSWTLQLGELCNKTLNSNTVMYWRSIKANLTNKIVSYNLVYIIRNISNTHRVYVVTIGKLKEDSNSYSYVFTFANYWFKDKTVFFGDWIVLPEGASSLRRYYSLLAYGVRWLSSNVYSNGSPGYVPQAYRQIANVLESLARSIPAEIDLPVEKGYSLVVDVPWLPVLCIATVIIGHVALWVFWENKPGAFAATILIGLGWLCVGYYIPVYKSWISIILRR